ncbi:hypothetical protein KFK09_015104 [Dendrobium nobile]|uniref:Uncharacterized protein n=1 Tax=Dendrobium nobile TaxID=94219 RepID=A0A8T3B582_DENNO|nr:hypothetical protein KFK09_015104 [Dendrobium nobile]
MQPSITGMGKRCHEGISKKLGRLLTANAHIRVTYVAARKLAARKAWQNRRRFVVVIMPSKRRRKCDCYGHTLRVPSLKTAWSGKISYWNKYGKRLRLIEFL